MRLIIAWRNLLAKPVQSSLTVLVISTVISMMLIITLLFDSVHNGLVKATEPFDLMAGAKGSPHQLVLGTVFLQDTPIGNISHELYEKLADNPLVASAIPLAFGDNYKGYAIIGAGSNIFQHQPKAGQQEWLQFAVGRPFTQAFEAVIGAKTASELGLQPGDTFQSIHGLLPGGEGHAHPYQVVGILQAVNGPYDRSILVSIESIWETHEHHEKSAAVAAQGESKKTEHEQEVTAVLVKPKGYSEAMRLYQQFQQEQAGQLVFPAQVIVRLLTLMGQGEQVLRTAAYLVIGLGLMIMALSLYWSALSRARERAILRALGAGSRDIFIMILAEAALLTGLGTSIGGLSGFGLYALLAKTLELKTALVFTVALTPASGCILLSSLLLGLAAGSIPAVYACRENASQHL